jgi:hypothetical protein
MWPARSSPLVSGRFAWLLALVSLDHADLRFRRCLRIASMTSRFTVKPYAWKVPWSSSQALQGIIRSNHPDAIAAASTIASV